MPNARSLLAAMALALVALPAAAGLPHDGSAPDGFAFVGGDVGWELAQHRYFDAKSAEQPPRASTPASVAPPSGDFRFVGGESGWELVAPAYAWRGGRLVRSEPIQAAPRPKVTTGDLDEMARLYAGG